MRARLGGFDLSAPTARVRDTPDAKQLLHISFIGRRTAIVATSGVLDDSSRHPFPHE
jgi:hypothetical protein